MFDWLTSEKVTAPRKGMPSPRLDEAEFKRRFKEQFQDRSFDGLAHQLDQIGKRPGRPILNPTIATNAQGRRRLL